MRFQEIREAFKLCGVSISDGGVLLMFPRYEPPDALSVSVDDEVIENIGVFRELTSLSDSVSVLLMPGRYAGFSFNFQIPIESTLVFRPMETAAEHDERIQRVFDESSKVISKDFFDVFQNVNMLNMSEVSLALQEIEEIRSRREVKSLKDISDGFERWRQFEQISAGFLNGCNLGLVTIEHPDFDLPFGSVEFHMESKRNKVFEVKNIDGFSQMVYASSAISMDSYTDKGVSMMTLTVFS